MVRVTHYANKIQRIALVNAHWLLSNATFFFFWQSAVFCHFSACVKLLKVRARHSSVSKGLLQIEKWL